MVNSFPLYAHHYPHPKTPQIAYEKKNTRNYYDKHSLGKSDVKPDEIRHKGKKPGPRILTPSKPDADRRYNY